MADERSKTGRQIGATGETVRRNIRWIRDGQGMSGAELSEALERLGRPINVLGIQRIEAGTRRVDVDDLTAIAVALSVSPASLLMPLRKDAITDSPSGVVPSPGPSVQAEDLVSITGWHTQVSGLHVWDWLVARVPFVQGTMPSLARFGLPLWERVRLEGHLRAELARRGRLPRPEEYGPFDFNDGDPDGDD